MSDIEKMAEFERTGRVPVAKEGSSGYPPKYLIEGEELEDLRASLTRPYVAALRLEFRRDGFAYKVDAGMWSQPVGTPEPRN